MTGTVVVLGIFAADLAFTAPRLPRLGETLAARGFALGPGGKGSNQAVAAARSGARVRLVSRIGEDAFGAMARDLWSAEGIDIAHVRAGGAPTGAAFIFLEAGTGQNAIIVESGAAGLLSAADIEAAEAAFRGADIFLTQLEQPVEAAIRGLEMARRHGLRTILNPAPAGPVPDAAWCLCDVVTPNESEAAALTGIPVTDAASARAAGEALLARGVGCAVVTLGAEGVLVCEAGAATMIPAVRAGPVVDTTGAGDAFAGAFAAALAEGRPTLEAARFGCAVAGLAVTRPGAALSVPRRDEVAGFLA
ncbi:ribokinase [Salinarimonas soli]|uniref:Ribokinase n=1 Tax=Salinarimonas soli TaxID=1638099 RepID=A0A5B2VGB2_9HYPH|nr:ribokinase [Salinarimonas soli]KAA2237197.1 ribokinase [Salinarimonas soli]